MHDILLHYNKLQITYSMSCIENSILQKLYYILPYLKNLLLESTKQIRVYILHIIQNILAISYIKYKSYIYIYYTVQICNKPGSLRPSTETSPATVTYVIYQRRLLKY